MALAIPPPMIAADLNLEVGIISVIAFIVV